MSSMCAVIFSVCSLSWAPLHGSDSIDFRSNFVVLLVSFGVRRNHLIISEYHYVFTLHCGHWTHWILAVTFFSVSFIVQAVKENPFFNAVGLDWVSALDCTVTCFIIYDSIQGLMLVILAAIAGTDSWSSCGIWKSNRPPK